jgi:hypothetical protein
MRISTLAAGAAAVTTVVLGAVPATAATAVTPVRGTSTPMCATSQLTAALGGGDAGAGNLYRYLVLTNHSGTTCHVTGFPGLSMLDAKGKQIGAPATYQQLPHNPVVLRPGQSASDTIHTINQQGTCLPTSTKLRIYPPGNRDALVFPGQVTNCDNQFVVTPFAFGKGGNPSNTPPSTPATPTARPTPTKPGQQVPVVPSGAPNTGLAPAAKASGSNGDETELVASGAVLALGALGVVMARRRSQARARG